MTGGPDPVLDRREHGLLAEIPRLHLLMRLGYRLEQALTPGGAARRGRLRIANVVSAALDVATYGVLKRTPGSGIGWRLPLDALDQALWESVTPDGSVNAIGLGLPLALESTVRWGFAGLGVPAVDIAAIAAMESRRVGGTHRGNGNSNGPSRGGTLPA